MAIVDIEQSRKLVPESVEAAEVVGVARDEAAAAMLEIAQRPKA